MRRRRVRHHANPLSVHHLDTGAKPTAVPDHQPLEVELGCADAEFLFARCLQNPSRSYVGVEIRQEHVERVNEQAKQLGLRQLQAVYANLLFDLETLFRSGSIDLCHINFPDPCFKKDHHKRRFFTPELARSLAQVIRPQGVLAYQSDIFESALEALDILEADDHFSNIVGEWTFARQNPYGAQSRRERRCLERGQRIWRLQFTRRG